MLYVQKNEGNLKEVFNLIKEVYALEGYTFSFENFIRYRRQRTVFSLCKERCLVGTISLIECQGEETLPLSTLFAKELGEILTKYSKVYEVGNFAIDKSKVTHRFSQEALHGPRMLFKAVYEEAKELQADLLVIVVNPKHLAFYKIIGFTEFGEQKFYPTVSAGAIPLYLEIGSNTLEDSFFTKL